MALTEDIMEYWKVNKDGAHWRGIGRWNDQRWQDVGIKHFDMLLKLCQMGSSFPKTMVEWGVGGGANAYTFRPFVEKYYGVDISQATLGECLKQVDIEPVLIDLDSPEKHNIPHVDFFLCTSVYQHLPSREYGIRIAKIAYEIADIAIIQIRYGNGDPRFIPRSKNYLESPITFTTFGIAEFWDIVTHVGFTPLAVILNTRVNYAYFLLRR